MSTPKNFLIVTHVKHVFKDGQYWAYGPYVREMNLWLAHVPGATVLAPLLQGQKPDPIDLPYLASHLKFVDIPAFELTSAAACVKALVNFPIIFYRTWKEIIKTDHLHLRCPGNMGLVGSLLQIFFPSKIKTAKYAANWDPASSQPFTYRLQKKILANQTFTRNIKVLTYGDWDETNKNLFPFFTASYREIEKIPLYPRKLGGMHRIKLIYVGGLQKAKNPILSLKVCHDLLQKGLDVQLDFYGDGPELNILQSYCEANRLGAQVAFHGNVPSENLKEAYRQAHFLIFVSDSEGWPKVVAEAMFWACLPITSPVSCVPFMLGEETRGDLVSQSVEQIAAKIIQYCQEPETYHKKTLLAKEWSQSYTLDRFENEIHKLLTEA